MPRGSGARGDRINMTGWDPEIITAEERRLAQPLIAVARLVFSLQKRRIFVEHKHANGRSFGTYSNRPPARKPGHVVDADARKGALKGTGVEGHYWVPPAAVGRARGSAAFVVERGRFKGWAAFRSFQAFMVASGRGPNVTLHNTGTLAQGMQIRPMGPMRVRISFYGGRRKANNLILGGSDVGGRRVSQAKNNRDLARILSSKMGPLLDLSKDDMRQVNAVVAALFTPQLIDLLKLAQTSVTARKRLRTRTNALRKIEAQFRQAKGRV